MATASTPRAKKSPTVHFDIAAAEAEVAEVELFTVKLPDGNTVTLVNPMELDWKVMAGLEQAGPFLFMRTVVAEEDQDSFFDQKIPLGVMRSMMTAYREHYGMDVDPGN